MHILGQINYPLTTNYLRLLIAAGVSVISVLSLCVSVFALRTQRAQNRATLAIQQEHHKRSVRPLGGVLLSDSPTGLEIKLVNRGCGPMYVKSFDVTRGTETKKNIVYHLPDHVLAFLRANWHSEPKSLWLSPGEDLVLLEFTGDPDDTEYTSARDTIREILKDMTVTLSSTDVYDSDQPQSVQRPAQ